MRHRNADAASAAAAAVRFDSDDCVAGPAEGACGVSCGGGLLSNSKERASSMSRVPARSTEKTRRDVQSARGRLPAGAAHGEPGGKEAGSVSGSGRIRHVSGVG
jgi:hypothetical protein